MTKFGGVSGEKLRQIVAKIERADEEKKEASEHLTDCYKEAKSLGFDSKILRKLIAQRKKDPAKVAEEQEVLDIYMHAMGMLPFEEFAGKEEGNAAGNKELTRELGRQHGHIVEKVIAVDELYNDAKKIILRDGKATISYLQRSLQIGFIRAQAIMEALEENKIVSEPDHLGKRTILVTTIGPSSDAHEDIGYKRNAAH